MKTYRNIESNHVTYFFCHATPNGHTTFMSAVTFTVNLLIEIK